MIASAEANRVQKNDENRVHLAREFLRDLYADGEHCSQDALANHVGISPSTLRRSDQLVSILRNHQNFID